MASWRATFAPLVRSIARLPSSFIAKESNAFSCKTPIATAVRQMATFERKKPHVNIGTLPTRSIDIVERNSDLFQVLLVTSITERSITTRPTPSSPRV
jgi:hypothetical protein